MFSIFFYSPPLGGAYNTKPIDLKKQIFLFKNDIQTIKIGLKIIFLQSIILTYS